MATAKKPPRKKTKTRGTGTFLTRDKFVVWSFTEESDNFTFNGKGQVFVDIVLAANPHHAQRRVLAKRPYAIIDGAERLHDYVVRVARKLADSPMQIEKSFQEIT